VQEKKKLFKFPYCHTYSLQRVGWQL